jgi:hypothetical protein
MASQAFFPVVVQTATGGFYLWGTIDIGFLGNGGQYVMAGLSPIAIIFTPILLIVAFSLLLGMGYLKKYSWVGLNRRGSRCAKRQLDLASIFAIDLQSSR